MTKYYVLATLVIALFSWAAYPHACCPHPGSQNIALLPVPICCGYQTPTTTAQSCSDSDNSSQTVNNAREAMPRSVSIMSDPMQNLPQACLSIDSHPLLLICPVQNTDKLVSLTVAPLKHPPRVA